MLTEKIKDMKKYKIINLWIVSLVLLFAACQPIEDRDMLENTIDIDGVQLVATQSTPGGNKVELNMLTEGVTGYWDYNLGRAYTDKVEFIYPIPGKSTFTFTGTLGAEFFTKTIDVQIDQLDNALDQDWYDLVSEETSVGKTWVFAGGPGADGGKWWYMSPPDDPASWETAWWNAAGDCCPPGDAAGKMHFDLNSGANYTYYVDASGDGEQGGFVLDVENQTLQIKGLNILGAEQGNPDGLYTIISLTEDELILYLANNAGGTGWTWVFKPE